MTEKKFIKSMNLVDSCAMVIGSMIGSGIFLVSAQTARVTQNVFAFIVIWFTAAVMTILAATNVSELASMFPKAGGQYYYLKVAYNKFVAFLYGYTLFGVIQTGTIAAVAVAFSKFLSVFIPQVSSNFIVANLGIFHISSLQLISVILIVLLTITNLFGVAIFKYIQNVFTSIKVLSLSAIVLLGILFINRAYAIKPNLANLFNFTNAMQFHNNDIVSYIVICLSGIIGPLFSMDAWNNVTFASEEVCEPAKNLPKSLIIGTFIVCILYLSVNFVYLEFLQLPIIAHAPEDRVATSVLEVLFGNLGVKIMALGIMIATFGGLNGLIMAGPRVYYAMACDKLFFKFAEYINPKTKVPTYGLILQCVWACLLTLSGSYSNLLDYVIFATLLFYLMTVYAIKILRSKNITESALFKVPYYPITIYAYIFLALIVMVSEFLTTPKYCLMSILIVISGIPIYFINKFFTLTKITQIKKK